MRALVITQQGTPVAPNVRLDADWPEPDAPDIGEVRVRVLATAFNHLDLWMGRGLPGWELEYPHVMSSDICGEVVELGEDVDEAWLGRRVILNAALEDAFREHPDDPPPSSLIPDVHLLGETLPGVARDAFVAPVEQLAAVGDGVDTVDAAAFGLTFLTAYSMLRGKADIAPGQSVLVTGIGGGVATAALALCKHLGCHVCVTSRHQWKLDKAADLGADKLVLDEGQDWSKDVRRWTRGRGVDVAVDSSGKATHLHAIRSLARGGAYVTPGCTSGPDATTDLARIFWNQLRVLGSTMGTPAEMREVTSLLNAGHVRPVIDRVYDIGSAREAVERLEAGEQFGKIVLRWAEG